MMKPKDERREELYLSCCTYESICAHAIELENICDRMLTDYLVCAEDKYLLDDALHHTDRMAGTQGVPIIKRIEGTKEGERIQRYIDRLHEMGVDV